MKITNIKDLREWDVIIINGPASSPIRPYTNLRATVATISDQYIKVWPEIETPEDQGKIWFEFSKCSVELVSRDDEIWG